MKSVKFNQSNVILGKTQSQYNDLHAHIRTDKNRSVISCFELSKEEIKEVAKTGKIWHTQQVFDQNYNPILLQTNDPFIQIIEPRNEKEEKKES